MVQRINVLRYNSGWKNYGGYDGLPKFLISFSLRVFSILFMTFGCDYQKKNFDQNKRSD